MSEAKAAAKETELTEQFKNPAIADGNDGTAEGRDVFVEEKKDCCRQTRILLKKNFLMQKRNKTASGAQALVGVAFIIILLIPLSPVGHVFVFGAIQRFFPDFFPSCYTERRQNLVKLYAAAELDRLPERRKPGADTIFKL